MTLIVPTTAVPNQTIAIGLGGQSCKFNLYQKSTGLYADVSVSNTPVIVGVLCLDRTLIVRDAYLGFINDIYFFDVQGTMDPVYSGLGSRFFLAYTGS